VTIHSPAPIWSLDREALLAARLTESQKHTTSQLARECPRQGTASKKRRQSGLHRGKTANMAPLETAVRDRCRALSHPLGESDDPLVRHVSHVLVLCWLLPPKQLSAAHMGANALPTPGGSCRSWTLQLDQYKSEIIPSNKSSLQTTSQIPSFVQITGREILGSLSVPLAGV
jgi:hypothetical protein